MKYSLFVLLLLAAGGGSALAQNAPAPAKQPVVLKPGRMQPQARPAANRPDVAPQFPGGPQALSRFLQEQVKYPAAAQAQQLSGSVVTSFTVGADGRVSDAKVVKGLSPECDAEALRVLSLMPAWKPAMRKGQPLPIQVQVPVPFGVSKGLKVEKSKVKFE